MNIQTTRTRPALRVIQGNPNLDDDYVDPEMMKLVVEHVKAGSAKFDEICRAREAAGMPPPVMMPEAFSDYMIEFWASLRSAHMLFLSNEAKRRGRALTEKEKDELSTGFVDKFTEGRKNTNRVGRKRTIIGMNSSCCFRGIPKDCNASPSESAHPLT